LTATTLSGTDGISRAAKALEAGELVAVPTETVYGLAADALKSSACEQIFRAKGRPANDPLIVHLPDASWLDKVAEVTSAGRKLARAFWPGPLTLVLKKRAIVPDIVTSGKETVAVRISAHPVFAELLRQFSRPVAAPSANRFGRVSPTRAEHVIEELKGRINWVLDGGGCEHGIESTIVRVTSDDKGVILRKGPITRSQLRPYVELVAQKNVEITPGSLPGHYAPRTRLVFGNKAHGGLRCGYIAWKDRVSEGFECARTLTPTGDASVGAASLYASLRELDKMALDLIVVEPPPEGELAEAVRDRLQRAVFGSGGEGRA